MAKIEKVVIFGAGDCGRKLFDEIDVDVVCFVDNDPKKQGTECCSKPIIAPADIHTLDYDYIVIASIYESEIRRQLVQMRLEDRILNSFKEGWKSACLPVNFSNFDCSADKIRADARYAYEIAQGYIGKFVDGVSAITGKSILELGPGINFGTALILICLGAKQVTVSDRFLARFDEEYHSRVYREIITILQGAEKSLDVSPIFECLETKSHNIKQLIAVESPLEELAELFPDEFDVTFSNAVFEHLYEPLQAFENLYRCMATGAIGSHQVDFRDHRDFDRPLEFLLLDELSFYRLMQDANCEFGNRIRPFQMQAMFEKVGFRKVSLDINMTASHEYMEDLTTRLKKSRFSTYSEVDPDLLVALSGNFLLQK